MMQQCATWETCMTRDPSVVGRAKVGAQMLGEVMDSFVDSISWKTWVCLFIFWLWESQVTSMVSTAVLSILSRLYNRFREWLCQPLPFATSLLIRAQATRIPAALTLDSHAFARLSNALQLLTFEYGPTSVPIPTGEDGHLAS